MDEDFSIWTEKYRPETFREFKGHDAIKERAEAFVKNKNMPHLIFAGPAGVGKTSLALVIARELYGENWRHNFQETNASDSRGIDVVRNEIKDFARSVLPVPGGPIKRTPRGMRAPIAKNFLGFRRKSTSSSSSSL